MLRCEMDDHHIHDLLIVGAGPVGAAAANLAGAADLDTVAIDPSEDVFPLPRAIHFDAEIMRIFQAAGIADRVVPLTRASSGSVHVGADGEPIREFRVGDAPTDLGWRPHYMFFQPQLDALLREAAGERENVDLRLGVSCTDVTGHGDHVEATLSNATTVRARYLLACDGASSPVRKRLGIQLFDYDFDEPWIIIDTHVGDPDQGPDHMTMYCDPRRPGTYVPGPGRHRRWEFMLLPGETGEELRTREGVRSLIEPITDWLADVDEVELIRSAIYRFHALVAEEWSSGRVFLAGDAVHQTPPFYGQGMCHGIRDVHNLVWKLRHVLDGRADEGLLATYQPEREPHVRAIIEAAVENGRYICTLDPVVAASRDTEFRERMRAGLDVGSFRKVIPPLSDGLIEHGGGELFPQPFPGADADLGDGFALVVATEPPHSETLAWFERDLRGRVVAGRPVEHAAVLVRPDRYVFGAADSPREIPGLLARLRDACSDQGNARVAASAPAVHHPPMPASGGDR
jgi:3-(3-hydroxy-phenyl)propionate hydroxylase